MRHRKAFRKLTMTSSHRKAMFRNMATSLLRHEQLETTVAKAKDLRRVVEPLIALAAKDTLPGRRRAYSILTDKAVVHKLFADIGPRFKARKGGYTRVVRTRIRHGDAAELAVICLVEKSENLGAVSKKTTATKKAAPTAKAAKSSDESTKSEKKTPTEKSSAKKAAKKKA